MTSSLTTRVAQLLVQARHELDRIDHKAELVLAGCGVATGVILTGLASAGTLVQRVSTGVLAGWGFGALAWLAGLALLAAAVYPRSRVPGRAREDLIGYFDDVLHHVDPVQLRAAMERSAANSLDADVDQLFHVSGLVARKYQLVRMSMWLLGGGATAILLASAAHLAVAWASAAG